MTRADLLAADLEAALVDIAQGSVGSAARFLDRLARLERLGVPEYRMLVQVAITVREEKRLLLGEEAVRAVDTGEIEDRAARIATAGDGYRAFELGLDVLLVAEIAPWLPLRPDLEPILAWWDAVPASFLALPELAASRWAHERYAPVRVRRVLSRMSAVAVAVLADDA